MRPLSMLGALATPCQMLAQCSPKGAASPLTVDVVWAHALVNRGKLAVNGR
jgi:hypothetical protein